MKRALMLVALLVAPLMAPAPSPAVAAAPPQQVVIEDLLPPGARNALGVFRVLQSLGARNRVYREAGHVQRELRVYYDAQIQTAQQQLFDREQLGLQPSQGRAYWRVLQRLKAERQFVLDLTEDEKRGAKYGFESRLRRELSSAIIRAPRVQAALSQVRGAVGELQVAFEGVRGTIETGNPVSSALAGLEAQLVNVEQFSAIVEVVHGPSGNALTSVTDRVRGLLAEVRGPIDEAVAATDRVLGELDGIATGIEEQIDTSRSVRADAAVRDVTLAVAANAIFAPRDGNRPETDVMANAITRGHSLSTAADIGRAADVLDVDEFNRMRDRVRAALLGNTLERIKDICGRIVGLARRIQFEAAARGEPVPDTSSPCTLFGNPEALQAFIDTQQSDTTVADEPPDTSVDSTTTTTESVDDADERTRRELLELAAGAYEPSPDYLAAIWSVGENVVRAEANGVIAVDESGTVVGQLDILYTVTDPLGENAQMFAAEYAFGKSRVVVDGDRLTFSSPSTFSASQNGRVYGTWEPIIDGVIDPATGELVLTGLFTEPPLDTATFVREPPT